MKLQELVSYLDSAVPLTFQEDYDNSGLQCGNTDKEIASALVTLDVTEAVLDEAVTAGCDVIISHHPLIFSGIKQLTGKTVTQRILLKAIKNDIAIYSAHTNLDAFKNGVSRKMADKINLKNVKALLPLKDQLLKLVVYIPENYLDQVRDAIFEAGAGMIGNYDLCAFTSPGTGSFRGNDKSRPFTGESGKMHFEKEIRFETVMFTHLKEKVIKAMTGAHPYEEVAYDLYALENKNMYEGMGCVGELPVAMEEADFLKYISSVFQAESIRHSKFTGKMISKVALCGGSGASLLHEAVSSGAHTFVTADVKYHTFFEAEDKILLADIGHFESEKFSAEILFGLINKKFPKFAVRFSEINTNPINYLYDGKSKNT